MKKALLSLLLVLTTAAVAQTYDNTNTEAIRADVMYVMQPDGFYLRTTGHDLFRVSGKPYAYDKAQKQLHVVSERANCTVTLTKDAAKEVKKNKAIPQLKGEALTAERDRQTKVLDTRFAEKNAARRQHIADSIAKARADSIAKAREDSIAREEQLAAERRKVAQYRANTDFHHLPTGGAKIVCNREHCATTCTDASVLAFAIKPNMRYDGDAPAAHADSVCFVTYKEGFLGLDEPQVHSAAIPNEMRNNEDFQFHCQVFADSLFQKGSDYTEFVHGLRYYALSGFIDEVRKEAPYGFVEDWTWANNYGNITLDLTYFNTNAKTIRYIDVYFRVTNDVGDTRSTGHFRGTGPVEQYCNGRWDWDESASSNYCFYGDASKMSITKIILTYNGGSKRTLTGNQLRFDWEHDE